MPGKSIARVCEFPVLRRSDWRELPWLSALGILADPDVVSLAVGSLLLAFMAEGAPAW